MAANRVSRPWAQWFWLGGCGLLVLAARSREVHLHGGDIPVLDQWKAEAADLLRPWLEGRLGPADFLRPHNGHVPAWTRLLAWLEVVVTGRWDPRTQMAVNAVLHAGFVVVALRWLRTGLAPWAAGAASALLVTTAALPFAWENITWGFQSQFPFALLFLLLHVPGVLTLPPYSRGWWAAQLAGLAGLFTLGTMWTAPLAVGLVLGWTGSARRPGWLVLAGLVAAGGLLAWIAPTATDSALFVHTLPVFLHAWFVQLGWPTDTVLVNLPLFLLALQLRGRRDAPAYDRVVLALGLWSALQATAIAYARSAEYIGFTSRYGDLLAVGLLANFLALLRLAAGRSVARWAAAAGLGAWLGVVGTGLYTISTTSHTAYFHQHSAERNARRAEAVQGFVRDGDIGHLADGQVRDILFPDPAQVAVQLAEPRIRALLPALAGPSAIGTAVRWVQRHWAWVALLGVAAAGWGLAGWGRPESPPALDWRPDPWRLPLVGGVAVAAFAALFLWSRPFVFGEVTRKTRLLQASGTIAPLRYAYVGPALYPAERMVGAALVTPGEVRNLFFGPVDLATVRSNSFHLVTPRLIVPFAGDPRAPGVALRLVVEDNQGRVLHTYTCAEPRPADVGFWEVEVTANQKRPAYLELSDQSAGAAGWIAVAPPQYAWKPGQAEIRSRAWAAEATAPTHDALGRVGVLAVAGAAGIAWRRRRGAPAAG